VVVYVVTRVFGDTMHCVEFTVCLCGNFCGQACNNETDVELKSCGATDSDRVMSFWAVDLLFIGVFVRESCAYSATSCTVWGFTVGLCGCFCRQVLVELFMLGNIAVRTACSIAAEYKYRLVPLNTERAFVTLAMCATDISQDCLVSSTFLVRVCAYWCVQGPA
jgi:hypothetical protein